MHFQPTQATEKKIRRLILIDMWLLTRLRKYKCLCHKFEVKSTQSRKNSLESLWITSHDEHKPATKPLSLSDWLYILVQIQSSIDKRWYPAPTQHHNHNSCRYFLLHFLFFIILHLKIYHCYLILLNSTSWFLLFFMHQQNQLQWS